LPNCINATENSDTNNTSDSTSMTNSEVNMHDEDPNSWKNKVAGARVKKAFKNTLSYAHASMITNMYASQGYQGQHKPYHKTIQQNVPNTNAIQAVHAIQKPISSLQNGYSKNGFCKSTIFYILYFIFYILYFIFYILYFIFYIL